MPFDLSGARKEGYSDSEIASYLSGKSNFNLQGALDEGYTDLEIIQHLLPEEKTTIGGQIYETAKGVPRGFVNSFMSSFEGLAELADTVTDAVGLEDAIDSGDENWLIEQARNGRDLTNRLLGVNPAYREKWTTKFGEGLGSFASFLMPTGAVKLLGYTGKAAKWGARIPTGAIAVGGGAGDQARRIEMAREQGVDVSEAQELTAIVGGALVGLSELAPVEHLLKNITLGAGKGFRQRLYQAILQGGVEGFQEVAAAWAQNAIEEGVYNENIPEGQSLWDDFTVGGAVGFAADFVLNAAAGRRRTTMTDVQVARETERREQEEEQVADFRASLEADAATIDVVDATIDKQRDVDPAQIENPNEEAFNNEATDADTVNSLASNYGRLIAQTMGVAFPTNTQFGVEEGDVVDTETSDGEPIRAQTWVVVDSNNKQYGTPQFTYERAAQLAYSLDNQLISHSIRESVKGILHTSPDAYTPEQADELFRYGLRVMHPDFITFSSAAINQAAGTTQDVGYEESLSAAEAVENNKNLTAAQKINKKRLDKGLSEQDSFTVREARSVLGKDFGKLSDLSIDAPIETETYEAGAGMGMARGAFVRSSAGEYIYTRPRRKPVDQWTGGVPAIENVPFQSLADAQNYADELNKNQLLNTVAGVAHYLNTVPETAFPKDITAADITRLLESKNISSKVNSPEIKTMMKALVGRTDLGKMSAGERRLVYNRLRSMPRLSVLTKLPVFTAKPYTREEFSMAARAVEDAGESTIEIISAATNISPDETGGKNKLRAIKKDLKNHGLSQKELAEKAKEEPVVIAGLLTGPDNGLLELRARLRAELDRVGLKEIGLRIDKELQMQEVDPDGNPIHTVISPDQVGPYQTIQGHYQPALKTIFLGLDNVRLADGATPEQRADAVASILNHEMVHAMRQLDLWTAKEWFLLENLARRKINKETGMTYVESAARDPAQGGYADRGLVEQMEEAIAEMFRHARRDNTIITGKPRSLVKRLFDFIEKFRSAMNGTGFQSFNDVISRVNTGEIGARKRGEIRTLRATEEAAGVAPERGIGFPVRETTGEEEGEPVVGQAKPDFLASRASRAALAPEAGGVWPDAEPILMENKVTGALDALMRETGDNPSSKDLARVPGAPTKRKIEGTKKDNPLDADVKPTPMETLRNYARRALDEAGITRWYDKFALGIRDIVGTANMDEASVIFGITSAQQSPEQNLSDTLHIMRAAREVDPVADPEGFKKAVRKLKPNGTKIFSTGNQINRIIRMYTEGFAEGGLKTTTYAQLIRDRANNVFNPYSVQDVHMARLFGFRRKKKKGKNIVDDAHIPGKLQYQYAEHLTTILAKEFDVTPDQMQAALWFYSKQNISPDNKRGRFSGTWESAYNYTEADRKAIETQIDQGIFNKDVALTPALIRGIDPKNAAARQQTKPKVGEAKVIKTIGVPAIEIERARREAPELRLEAAPGSKRGYGFPSGVTLKQKIDFNNRAIETMTDVDGQIPALRMMGIPHEVNPTYGTYDAGVVPGISVKLLGGNLDQASMAASLLGDALLQDAAVTMKPSFNGGGNVGFSVRKADGEAFTENELIALAESVNPEHDPDGLNFSQTEPDTAIFMDSRQYWDKSYNFDSSLDQFYNDLASKLPAALDLVTEAYYQNGEYIESKDYQKGIAKIRDQGITTRRSDLYRRIDDTLYQPLWNLYTEEAATLEFTPENTRRPTIANLLGFPIASDIRAPPPSPIPKSELDAAVEKTAAEAKAASAGAVPLYGTKASPEAQYVARNPEKAAPLPEGLRSKFSRANGVPLSGQAENVLGRTIGDSTSEATPGETYIESTEGMFRGSFRQVMERFRMAAVNKYAPIERLSRHPLLRGLLADSSAIAGVVFADRSRGVLAAALKDGVITYKNGLTKVIPFIHKGKTYRGLIDVLAPLYNTPSGQNLERLAQGYAVARRNKRLNDQGKISSFKEGDLETMEAEIQEHLNPETGRPIVEEWYDAWQAYNQYTVDFLIDTGLLNVGEARHWLEYSDYFPFYKEDYSDKIDLFAPVGKSVQSGKPVNVPMLDAITRNLSMAIDLGMRNVARQRVIRDAVTIGIARDANGISTTKEDDVVNFRVNGQPRRFIVDDPLLYQSMNTLADTGLGPITTVLSAPSTLLRAMVTREPGFVIANLIRDTLSAYATSGSDFVPVLDTLRGFTGGMKILESYGVVGGYDFKNDPRDIVKFISRESRKRGGKVGELGKVEELFETPGLKFFKRAWQVSGQVSTMSDAATRKAVYDDVLARTGNEAEAAYQALEIINFSRRGGYPLFRNIFAMTPFLNARIQGLDVLYRSFLKGTYSAKQDVSRKKIILTAFTRGSYLVGLTALYWTLISDEDEYKKASQHERDNYWLLPSGLGEDVPALRIPIPFEVGILFKMIPERILDSMWGTTTPRQLKQSMQRALTSTLEIQPLTNIAAWGPMYEAFVNKNGYTGQPIVPMWMDDDVAAGFQSSVGTNTAARLIGEKSNISPLKVEHVIAGYTGTLGRYALSMIDATLRKGLDEPVLPKKEFYEYPLIKRFFGSREGRGLQEQFYELKNEVDELVGTMRDLVKKGRLDEYQAFLASRSHLRGVMADVNYMNKEITRLRNHKNAVMSSDYFDAEYKAQIKREIDAQINEILKTVPELTRSAKLPAFGSPLR